jgi:hypothetical protein
MNMGSLLEKARSVVRSVGRAKTPSQKDTDELPLKDRVGEVAEYGSTAAWATAGGAIASTLGTTTYVALGSFAATAAAPVALVVGGVAAGAAAGALIGKLIHSGGRSTEMLNRLRSWRKSQRDGESGVLPPKELAEEAFEALVSTMALAVSTGHLTEDQANRIRGLVRARRLELSVALAKVSALVKDAEVEAMAKLWTNVGSLQDSVTRLETDLSRAMQDLETLSQKHAQLQAELSDTTQRLTQHTDLLQAELDKQRTTLHRLLAATAAAGAVLTAAVCFLLLR